ncbi:EAL domain-containing protein [Marinobacter subterrani]|uniref:bifunctional diguanylate cyclase/phosphodiesterase n=1 Tax=Marinobacter subterrani TaxID=1658765 RepID=UPI002355AE1E|nr:EAL domain-containing protein [Marinobacter subterrani]
MTHNHDADVAKEDFGPAASANPGMLPPDARIYRLTQIYRALSEINQAIIRMSDERELFPLVCRIAVEYGGVNMAWIGVVEEGSEHLVPVERSGIGTDYLESLRISTQQGNAEGQGPSATAYRENRPVIVNQFANSPITAPWHERAKRFGWESSGCFPIQRNGKPYAVLSVYHQADDFFDSETISLLEEMAQDISFALDNFDRENERRAVLEALRAKEQHFRAYFERSMLGMAATRPDRSWLEANESLCDMLGYSIDELCTKNWEELTYPEDLARNNELFGQLLDGRINEFVIEKRFIRKTGELIDAHLAVRAVRNEDGSLAYAVSLIEDITHRKQAERRESMRRRILEKVAKGGSLDEIMRQVTYEAEAIYPGSMCSILVADERGERLLSGAAPSLPDFFNEAVNGIPIAEGVGSCGTAAYLRSRIIVEDIASHPYWKDYKDLAAKVGVSSCWSEPVLSASGEALGTFGIYRREPGLPDDQEIALIESAANLVGIAIERQRAEKELHLASSIYSHSAEAVLVTDADNKIIAVNPAFTRITGYTLADVRGKDPSVLRSGRHDPDFYRAMWQDLLRHGEWQGEIWNRRKDGETFPAWLTINAIRNEKGDIQRYVALGSDISNKIRSDELIWRQANYDFLTDLPNRHMFQDRLEHELRKARRHQSLLALFFVDLDHFKDVNDTLGHTSGDRLLIDAAERISRCLRESDTVARMGGDEFTVILPDLTDPADAEGVATHIITALAEPYVINGQALYLSASIGITFYPEDSTNADQLLRSADQAMYSAKHAGRNCIRYFTKSLHDSAQNRLTLINDMRVAVAQKQFELHFQPIVDLRTGRVVKAEALIRWHHPERGMISPVDFIPLAEESGLIVEIGDWVFREAATWAKRWNDLFKSGIQVSVNTSPSQFQSDAFKVPEWLAYLQALDLHEKYLSIEITEGLLLNASKQVTDKLLRFRDAGIQVAIDDFGVGYSALSYLKRFDIDYLKIDQSFIRNLGTEDNDLALSEAIVIMAHKLGLQVIAEGVETETQRRLLLDIGCDCGQGYLFSRPLPAEAFETFLGGAGKAGFK